MAKKPAKKADPKPKTDPDAIPGIVDASGNAIRHQSSIHGDPE